jgi:hypothetical protein
LVDSRVLARAFTGDLAGAVEDFTAFLAWAPQNSVAQERVLERTEWIEKLRDQKLPAAQVFTADVLKKLRNE